MGVRMKTEEYVGTMIGFVLVALIVAAWFTHLYVCFTEQAWGFLIGGAIFFPVAIVHGAGIWLGVW